MTPFISARSIPSSARPLQSSNLLTIVIRLTTPLRQTIHFLHLWPVLAHSSPYFEWEGVGYTARGHSTGQLCQGAFCNMSFFAHANRLYMQVDSISQSPFIRMQLSDKDLSVYSNVMQISGRYSLCFHFKDLLNKWNFGCCKSGASFGSLSLNWD